MKQKLDDCFKIQTCPIGYTSDSNGATSCVKLPGGLYKDENGVLQDCPSGTYCPFGFTGTTPLHCPTDKFCGTRTITPANCPPGQYPSVEQGSCLPCPTGSYCPNGMPIYCPTGTYSLTGGAISTTDCVHLLGGNYVDQQNILNICPTGTYCPTGFTGTSPLLCPTGTYNDTTGNASCTPCASGTYSDTTGSSTCKSCISHYLCTYGSTGPSACASGTYTEDSKQCLNCEAGYACPICSIT